MDEDLNIIVIFDAASFLGYLASKIVRPLRKVFPQEHTRLFRKYTCGKHSDITVNDDWNSRLTKSVDARILGLLGMWGMEDTTSKAHRDSIFRPLNWVVYQIMCLRSI